MAIAYLQDTRKTPPLLGEIDKRRDDELKMPKSKKNSMGNNPPLARKSGSNSPSLLTAFGFSRQKRSSVGGEEGTPPKRAKSTVKVEATNPRHEAAQTDNRRIVVDLTQSSSSCDSVGVRSAAIDSRRARRGQRARIIRIDDDRRSDDGARSIGAHRTAPAPNAKATAAPSPISPPKTTASPRPQRATTLRPVNALGLVRVRDPNHILCTTAAAEARNPPSLSGSQPVFKLFPGATLGRTSNSSRQDPAFVDIGIESGAKGISRRHLNVVRVRGLRSDDDSPDRDPDERSVLTSRSAASAVSDDGGGGPSLLLRVVPHPHPPKTTVKVVIHRTRRNRRRTLELKQGECKTLRIGDAIEFLSDVNRYYCLVGFHSEDHDVVFEGGSRCAQEMEAGGVDDAGEIASKHDVLQDNVPASESNPLWNGAGCSQWMQSEMTQPVDDVDMEGGEAEWPASRDVNQPTHHDIITFSREENPNEVIGPSVRGSAAGKRQSDATSIAQTTTARTAIKVHSELCAATGVPTGEENPNEVTGSSVRESAAAERQSDATIIAQTTTASTAIKVHSELCAATVVPTGTKPDSYPFDTNNNDSNNRFDPSTESVGTRKLGDNAVAVRNAALENHPAKPRGLDSVNPTLKVVSEPDVATTSSRRERNLVPTPTIKKGDVVRVIYQVSDAFGLYHEEWHYGTVGLVRTNHSQGTHSINVTLGSCESDKLVYPNPEVEKVDDIAEVYSTPLEIGDFVECNFQNYKWYHGRVTDLSEDGTTCEVLYHDKDYEVNVPLDQNKIRLAMRCPSNYEWLISKPTLIGRKGIISSVEASSRGELCVAFHDGSEVSIPCEDVVRGNGAHLLSNCKPSKRKNRSYDWLIGGPVLIGRKGVIIYAPRDDSSTMFRVSFEDGSVESISRDEVLKGAFSCLLQGIGIDHQYVWPGSEKFKNNTKQQRDTKSNKASTMPMLKGGKKASNKRASVKFKDDDGGNSEPIPGHFIVFGASLYPPNDEGEDEDIADDENDFDDPDAEFRFIGKKKIALPLPPGIPNMLWHALNCPEAKTGASMLHEFLCVHDRVPGPDMIRKFWQLVIKGPKADGHNVYFKEPFMTELASQYVYGLIHHGKRLIRSDGSTLFGPSEWSDVESILSQSIDQTENMVAGKRLADGLHLAARGSKVLYMMLQYELNDVNTMSVLSNSFDSMSLRAKPTVKLFRHHSRGIREALKSVVKHTTKCLVRHSRFILDREDFHPEFQSCKENFYDDSCRIESRECFFNLANVLCYSAFLFCVAEKVPINDQCVLLLIRDEFEKELHRCLDDAPEMDKTSTNKFVRTLRETFLAAISEDFATPLFIGLAKMMGFENDLRLLGCLIE